MVRAPGSEHPRALAAPAELEVLEVKGRVLARTPRALRTALDSGSLIHRPAAISVESSRGKVVLAEPGIKLMAEHGARLMWNGSSASNAILLEDGFVLVSARSAVEVHVPRYAVKVTGKIFSVWLDEDRVRTAVIEDSVELQIGDDPPEKYARRRDIIVSGGTASPSLLASRLELSVQDVARRGSGFMVRGRTTPRAILLYRGEKITERIRVRSSGSFSAVIPDSDPRFLAAFDGSGRRAFVDVPSPTVDDFMEVAFGDGAHSTSP